MDRCPSSFSLLPSLLVLGAVLGALVPLADAQSLPHGRPIRPARVLRVPGDFPKIQRAIDHARDGDVVLVAPGTYTELVDFQGKAIEVVGTEGPTRTRIRAAGSEPVVLFRNGEGPESRLIGFTVSGGSGDFDGLGGGISCVSFGPITDTTANPYLSDLIVESNFTDQSFQGLGAAGIDGNPLLERCIVRHNQTYSPQTPGGVNGAVWMSHCLIEDNQGCYGGGLNLLSGAVVLDSILRDNVAGPCGVRDFTLPALGGALNGAANVLVERCLLHRNQVQQGTEPQDPGFCEPNSLGGGLYADGTLLRHCTIVGNTAEGCAQVGGIAGDPMLVDCIVRANEESPGEYAGRLGFTYCDVAGGAPGTGSFDAEPLFVDAGTGDFRLHAGSPCLDAGDPAGALDGDGTRGDVGALHRSQAASPLANAWHEGPRLQPADTAQSRGFGAALAFSGNRALVGARDAAYLFERVGGAWVERARLVPDVPQDDEGFGTAVALDGDLAVVGAPAPFGATRPSVYVFEPDASGAFRQTAHIESADFNLFGYALALDHGFLAVGAPGRFDDMGHVVLFHRPGRGGWTKVAELGTPHVTSQFEPEGDFGAAVALAGDTLVVGERYAGDRYDYFRPGDAWVYQRAGATPYAWVRVAEIAPPNPEPYGLFGNSVAVDGERVLVASSTAVASYGASEPGLPWRRPEPVGATGAQHVALAGDRAFVDGPGGVRELHQAEPQSAWDEVAHVTGLRGALATDGRTLLVGVANEDGFVGAVHVFTRGVQVDEIALDQAADAEPVTLRGLALDTVTRALVDGVAQPIVSQSATELVLQPPPRDPGRAELVLESAQGALTLPGGWRAAPTLAVETNGAGGTLDFTLENGASGAFALLFALDLNPSPIVTPPTWYGAWLDLRPNRSGRLLVAVFGPSGSAQPSFALPNSTALAGVTVHFQAYCRRGLFGPVRDSYSNLASVTF